MVQFWFQSFLQISSHPLISIQTFLDLLTLKDGRGQASHPRCSSLPGLLFGWTSCLKHSCSESIQVILNNSRNVSTRKFSQVEAFLYQGPAVLQIFRDGGYLHFVDCLLTRKIRGLSLSLLRIYLVTVTVFHPPMDGYLVFIQSVTVRFLKSLIKTFLPVQKSAPHWDLNLLLSIVIKPSFKTASYIFCLSVGLLPCCHHLSQQSR